MKFGVEPHIFSFPQKKNTRIETKMKTRKKGKQEEAREVQMDAFSAKQTIINFFLSLSFLPPLFLVDNERIDC